jgi:hypothetical protein
MNIVFVFCTSVLRSNNQRKMMPSLKVLGVLLLCGMITPIEGWKGIFSGIRSVSNSKLYGSPLYLERMVERKKAEVDSLLRRHQAVDDPLFMRMSYMASECRYYGSSADPQMRSD